MNKLYCFPYFFFTSYFQLSTSNCTLQRLIVVYVQLRRHKEAHSCKLHSTDTPGSWLEPQGLQGCPPVDTPFLQGNSYTHRHLFSTFNVCYIIYTVRDLHSNFPQSDNKKRLKKRKSISQFALHENIILYFYKWMNLRRGIDNFITFYFMFLQLAHQDCEPAVKTEVHVSWWLTWCTLAVCFPSPLPHLSKKSKSKVSNLKKNA